MIAPASVFLDFNLPNPTTWFYFSSLLAVAIFFRFDRLFSIRNLDVVMLFLLVPALMIIQTSNPSASPARSPAVHAAELVAHSSVTAIAPSPVFLGGIGTYALERQETFELARWTWLGYLWLLIGSGVFFTRCLIDLALVQRPVLAPNLSFGGLGWFGLALMVCLSAVAFRQHDRSAAPQQREGIVSPQQKTSPDSVTVEEARRIFGLADDPRGTVTMRSLAVLGQLAVVLGLMLIGRLHFQDATAGIAAAVFYLLLPYTGMFVSQVVHVWPMAIIVWALVAYRQPSLCGLLIGLAAGLFYYPVVLLPVMVSFYWGRGAWRFSFFFFLSLAIVVGAIAYNLRGELQESVRRAFDLAAWQPWKTPPADLPGFWTGVHAAYRIPVFIAFAAFVIAIAFWPMPKNLGHVLSLSSAVLIGTQFWYADQGGTYVLWYLPLLLLMVFRPNLEDRRPPLINRETDWLYRVLALIAKPFRRLVKTEELTKVS